MPRLKTLLACLSLSSFTRRAATPRGDLLPEPIRRKVDQDKSVLADRWMFEISAEQAEHAGTMDALTQSMSRLRERLSTVSAHTPIRAEAEPAMPLGAMSFDADLFDGEPMQFAAEDRAEGAALDSFLFEDGGEAPAFDAEPETFYRQAA